MAAAVTQQDEHWQILTRGPLFEAVQALRLFPDSKTFPDMIARNVNLAERLLSRDDQEQLQGLLRGFNELCLEKDGLVDGIEGFARQARQYQHRDQLSVADFKALTGIGEGIILFRSRLNDFVETHFVRCVEERAPAPGLPRQPTCSMEAYIDSVWSVLKRDGANLPQEMFSGTLIRLPHPYVVAGGRFDEVYYWDAYFIGEGLVLCGQCDLFECMVKNYATFILKHEFVPNGNRRYYMTRSQPPLFCAMVDLVVRIKGIDFAKNVQIDACCDNGDKHTAEGFIGLAEAEYGFWMGKSARCAQRVVHLGADAVLNRYWDHYDDHDLQPRVQPRPEAYHEDIDAFSRSGKSDPEAAAEFFRHIRAAAESGWDFSSRWFRPQHDPHGGLRRQRATIRTTDILPVDLNALLFGMETKLYAWTGKDEYAKAAARRKKALLHYFWSEELGWFFDYSVEHSQPGHTDVWSLAGAYPLFVELFDRNIVAELAQVDRMVGAIRERFMRPGGVVTTLIETGEQWDYPNGWAPLQWIVVRGLLNYGYRDAALEIAKRFLACVGRTYQREGRLMEKYNVCEPEAVAGGGEYVVQHGFGWTNGVVKALMHEFRADMEADAELRGYLG